MNRTSGSCPEIVTASLGNPLDSTVLIETMGELAESERMGPMPNDSDQRLATAGLATPLDAIASPLHRLVRRNLGRLLGK